MEKWEGSKRERWREELRCPIEFEAKFKRLSHMRRKLKELLIARLHPSELSLNLCQRLHPSSPFDFMLSLCLPLAFPYSMQWSVANVQHRQIDSYRSVYLSVHLIDCDLCSARLLPDKRLCTASECSLMQVRLAANAGGSRLTKAYTREGERERLGWLKRVCEKEIETARSLPKQRALVAISRAGLFHFQLGWDFGFMAEAKISARKQVHSAESCL